MAPGYVINGLKENSHHFLNIGNSREDLQNQQHESLQREHCFGAWKIHMGFVGYTQKENTAVNEQKSVKERQHMQLFLTLASSFGFPQILRFFRVTHRLFCIIFCLLASHPPAFLTVMKAKMLLLLNNY